MSLLRLDSFTVGEVVGGDVDSLQTHRVYST